MISIILLVPGALLAVIATVLLQEPVERLLARAFVRLPRAGRGKPQGVWFSYYEVVRPGHPAPARGTPITASEVEEVEFRSLGSIVLGRNTARSREYFLRLKFEDNSVLTGTWRDRSEGRYHFGGVQLIWDFDGAHMTGRFVGRDRNNHVNDGAWVFATRREDLQRLIDATRPRRREPLRAHTRPPS